MLPIQKQPRGDMPKPRNISDWLLEMNGLTFEEREQKYFHRPFYGGPSEMDLQRSLFEGVVVEIGLNIGEGISTSPLAVRFSGIWMNAGHGWCRFTADILHLSRRTEKSKMHMRIVASATGSYTFSATLPYGTLYIPKGKEAKLEECVRTTLHVPDPYLRREERLYLR